MQLHVLGSITDCGGSLGLSYFLKVELVYPESGCFEHFLTDGVSTITGFSLPIDLDQGIDFGICAFEQSAIRGNITIMARSGVESVMSECVAGTHINFNFPHQLFKNKFKRILVNIF